MSDSQRLPYEKHVKIWETAQKHPHWGSRKIAEHVGGVAKDAVAKYRKIKPQDPTEYTPAETNEIKGDKWTITLPRTRIHTLEQLVEHCQIDLSIWEVERFIANKWEMGYKNDAGKAEVVPLFQVKAFLRKNRAAEFAKVQIEKLKAEALMFAPKKWPAIITRPRNEDNMLELSPVDHHFGALIWGKETGGADYDTKIAEDCYRDAVACLIDRTKAYKPSRVVYIVGHDQQNADNKSGTTERGTPQNMDSRYQKVFEASFRSSRWGIDLALGEVGEVDVIDVPGNHDPLSAWHLGHSLECWYHNNPKVRVFNSPNPRRYYEHGTVMLLFTHGNTGKIEDYDRTMAAEQPAMWGRTKWHEAHTGDKHHRRLIELKGATVRILPSLRPPDAWTSDNHYVGAIRAAEGYVWSKREGLVGTACYSILGGK